MKLTILLVISNLALSSCGFTVSSASDPFSKDITIQGRLVAGRELALYDYKVMPHIVMQRTKCISGIGLTKEADKQAEELDGRVVKIVGNLKDYYTAAAADPIASTVDPVQNKCGNAYTFLAKSIRPVMNYR